MTLRVLRWLALACLAASCAAGAQEYPDKPVRLVVAYPADGPADIARIVADQLSLQLPQRVFVDNRQGAGGIIGTEVVVNAAPDGYTLLLSGNNIAIAQALANAPRRDSTRSFAHVAQIVVLPTGIFVNAQSPHTAFRDLIAFAEANSDKLTYASGGNGTPSHLAMEMLKRSAGIQVRHIPYKGTPPALTDVMGRQVDMLVTSIAGPMEQVKAGRLKVLAVSSPERLDQLPQVPAIAESVPGFSFETWLAISAPRGTSPAIVQKLAAEIGHALKDPALVKRMTDAGLKPRYLPPDRTTARMSAEQKAFAQVVKDANIRAELLEATRPVGTDMMVVGEAARAAGRRIDVPIQNGTRVAGKTDWLEAGKDASLSPSVFLVDLPPESVLDVHFHRENQFRLFVKGEGSIGPHRISPITVHYAGAYTGYGPLAAGPAGVSYFTIRPVYDAGAFYLPHARGDMVKGPKRNLQSEPIAPLDASALRALRTAELLDLIALQPDNIAARLLRLPPRTSRTDLDPRGSGGQFVVVVTGSIADAGRALGPLDMIFLSADEPPLRLQAQDDGAEVILLQLPVKAEAYVGRGWSHAQKGADDL